MKPLTRVRWLILVGLAVVLAGAAPASAARLYVAVGDSVGAGFGATTGHDFFDLYCAYLESAAGRSRVDQCINESVGGLTTASALSGGSIQRAITDVDRSTATPVVTVVLGGNDLLSPACQPITASTCGFMRNMRTILDELETAVAAHPGPHVIQWLAYYNPNHDNPFGTPSADRSTAGLLLGSDYAYTGCTSTNLGLIGLDDAINCIATEKGAIPVDVYTPFQVGCTNGDCFSDSLHPDDKGYGVIFDAVTATASRATISALSESRNVFAPSSDHHTRGTVFWFLLDRAAEVTVAIERQLPGRRVGRDCLAPARRLRHRPRCTRTIPITKLQEHGHAGRNQIRFSGRVRGRALLPGRYLAVFTAADAAGPSAQRTLRYTIVQS